MIERSHADWTKDPGEGPQRPAFRTVGTLRFLELAVRGWRGDDPHGILAALSLEDKRRRSLVTKNGPRSDGPWPHQ